MIKLTRMSKMGERGPGIKPRSRFLPLGMIAGPAGGLVTALLSNWKMAIFGVLIAIIAYQNFMSFEILRPFGIRTVAGVLQDLEATEKKAERQISVMAEQLAECEISREGLKDQIEQTNAQINQWVAVSQQLQEEQTRLTQALVDLRRKSTAELEIILQGPIPQTCEGAVKLLREAVTKGDLSWSSGS